MHVPDGVDVNQKSDPRHHHQHHGGQRIDQKSEIDVQVAAENPGIGNDFTGRGIGEHPGHHRDGTEKRQPDGPDRHAAGQVRGIPVAEQAVHQHRDEREDRYQYDK